VSERPAIHKTRILKLREHDEEKEIAFDLEWLASLSVAERFDLMFRKSEEIRKLLIQSGHGTPPEIVKRGRS
jgi:hypothetical protein